MATLDSVMAKIQSLIAKANAKTGRSDANMTNAVNALVSGYNPNGIIPSGTLNISANGTHNVTQYANASVNVPVGVFPSGTKTITTNGTHDVTNYASAQVNVPVGVTPTGTKTITTNGTHDVTNYASAQVNVPTGITPSGSINITANGTHNVTNYASAVVNVPTPKQVAVVRTVTIASDVTGAKDQVLLSNDEFIKKHYASEWFFAILISNSLSGAANVVAFNIQGNRKLAGGNTGVGFRYTSASAVGAQALTTNINGSGWGQHMRVNSSGNLIQYLHTGYILKAGTYTIVLISAE